MANYRHGVYTKENATALLSPISSAANVTFVVGTAPVHLMGEANNVNKLYRITSEAEAIKYFGYDKDFSKYTLSEAMDVFFRLYKVYPIYFVNVLNPAVHKTVVAPETLALVENKAILATKGAIKSSVVVKVATVVKALGVDYELEYNADNSLSVIRLAKGSIAASDNLIVSYNVVNPAAVTADDIIGGVDAQGNYSGIALASRVLPQFNEVVGSLIAPGYSHNTKVSAALTSSAEFLTDKFKANSIVDLDVSTLATYDKAVELKQKAGLTSPFMNLCMGDLTLSKVKYHQSTHLAALKQRIAGLNGNVPCLNPSNKNYICDGYQLNGKEIFLDSKQAEYLNANGIIVAINGSSGWKCWGNRTAAFPGSTDIKDIDIAVRDMFNWVSNSIILSAMQEIDQNIRRRNITRFEDMINHWLNGLVAQEYLVSGDFSFPIDLNPQTDIIAGITRYKLNLTVAPTTTEIEVIIEYDVNGLDKIFIRS